MGERCPRGHRLAKSERTKPCRTCAEVAEAVAAEREQAEREEIEDPTPRKGDSHE